MCHWAFGAYFIKDAFPLVAALLLHYGTNPLDVSKSIDPDILDVQIQFLDCYFHRVRAGQKSY